MAPAVGRRADEARHGNLAAFKLTNVMCQADRADEVAGRLLVDHPSDLVGHVIRVSPGRLVALVAPGLIGGKGLAADELERLCARFVAQRLSLEMGRDREDLESMPLRKI